MERKMTGEEMTRGAQILLVYQPDLGTLLEFRGRYNLMY